MIKLFAKIHKPTIRSLVPRASNSHGVKFASLTLSSSPGVQQQSHEIQIVVSETPSSHHFVHAIADTLWMTASTYRLPQSRERV
jgi:hypothetical protein